jgi:hypothetical protein
VQKAEQLGGDPSRVLEILGSTQALSGDMKAAQATVDKLRAGAFSGRVSPYSVTLIYTAMGRKADALDWLEKGYREKETWDAVDKGAGGMGQPALRTQVLRSANSFKCKGLRPSGVSNFFASAMESSWPLANSVEWIHHQKWVRSLFWR